MDIPKEMRNYFVGVMFAGPRRLERGTPEERELQMRHLAFNRRCAEEGKYKAFGPLMDGGEILAFSVVEVGSLEEAQALFDSDPTVQAGHARIEAHPLFWPSLDGVKIEYP